MLGRWAMRCCVVPVLSPPESTGRGADAGGIWPLLSTVFAVPVGSRRGWRRCTLAGRGGVDCSGGRRVAAPFEGHLILLVHRCWSQVSGGSPNNLVGSVGRV